MRPLGDRVLIRPVAQPTVSESGLIHLPDAKHTEPDQVGEIVALGSGRVCHAKHVQIEQLRSALSVLMDASMDSLMLMAESAAGSEPKQPMFVRLMGALDSAKVSLADSADHHSLPHDVEVGQTVVFSPWGGQEVVIDDERLIVMKEADLLAVIEPEQDKDRV